LRLNVEWHWGEKNYNRDEARAEVDGDELAVHSKPQCKQRGKNQKHWDDH
jgi:hypothetical protein